MRILPRISTSPWIAAGTVEVACRHVTLVSGNVAFSKRDRALAITLLFPGKYSAYIQKLHYNYLIAGVANPFEGQGNNALQLKMLLIGIKRTRLPIDSIINDAGKFLPCGYFSSMHTSGLILLK
jgi:hypothetical protein